MVRKTGPTIRLYEQSGWHKPGDEVIEEADGSIRIMGPEVGMASYGMISGLKLMSFYFANFLEKRTAEGLTYEEVLTEMARESRELQKLQGKKDMRDEIDELCEKLAEEFLKLSGIDSNKVNLWMAKQLVMTVETGDKDSLPALKELLRWGRTEDGGGEEPEVPVDALAKIFQNIKDSGVSEEELKKAMAEQYGGEDESKD